MIVTLSLNDWLCTHHVVLKILVPTKFSYQTLYDCLLCLDLNMCFLAGKCLLFADSWLAPSIMSVSICNCAQLWLTELGWKCYWVLKWVFIQWAIIRDIVFTLHITRGAAENQALIVISWHRPSEPEPSEKLLQLLGGARTLLFPAVLRICDE